MLALIFDHLISISAALAGYEGLSKLLEKNSIRHKPSVYNVAQIHFNPFSNKRPHLF